MNGSGTRIKHKFSPSKPLRSNLTEDKKRHVGKKTKKCPTGNHRIREKQDGGGVGGCGVHLSPWIHQEYTFRHRSAFRTTAENR